MWRHWITLRVRDAYKARAKVSPKWFLSVHRVAYVAGKFMQHLQAPRCHCNVVPACSVRSTGTTAARRRRVWRAARLHRLPSEWAAVIPAYTAPSAVIVYNDDDEKVNNGDVEGDGRFVERRLSGAFSLSQDLEGHVTVMPLQLRDLRVRRKWGNVQRSVDPIYI